MEILFWIVCISMLVGFGTGVLMGGTTSRSFEFSHAEMASSSSFSHKVANKIGDGGSITYLTGFGSVYHSRRDCGKLKPPKTVGKFLPCMECGQNASPRFYENRIPQPVKRK